MSEAEVKYLELLRHPLRLSKNSSNGTLRGLKMIYPVHLNDLTEDYPYKDEVLSMYARAKNYLARFDWCDEILSSELYLNLGETLCIFLFDIDNTASPDDRLIWIVVGDLPSMYLDTFGSNSTKEVLKMYSGLVQDWIDIAQSGSSLDEAYPLDIEPTRENIDMLITRVSFIKNSIIPNIDDLRLRQVERDSDADGF